jgi:glutathione S-transferase
MPKPKIILRYFDARGRVQFLRYYFEVRGIAYTDERIPLSADFSEWQAIRDDSSVTGPFKKLPVLHFDDEVLSETLVITSFLHEALGDAARLSAADNLRHRMLASSLYCDSLVPLGTLVWATRLYRGADLLDITQQTLTRLGRHLSVLDETLAAWRWLERPGPPMLADCLLWDQLMSATQIFGKHLRLGNHETLSDFFGEFPARAQCLKMLESHPCQFTGLPGEPEVLAAIRAELDSAAQAAR